MIHIKYVAEKIGIREEELEFYGKYKAKLTQDLWERIKNNKDGKLILVTAINPTPAGEGKTTTTIGLGQAMDKMGLKAIIALREPSLGPVFGIKGGGTGGGLAQVVPMEDINLHFTGDIHAVTAANNLLSAIIDNHIHHGNQLGIDPGQVVFRRAMDMNDRALRNVTIGLGGTKNGVPREESFNITAASEIMAVLCLAQDFGDLRERLGCIIAAYSYNGKAIRAKDLKADGAMAVLLRDAFKPNLVQTAESSPAIVHGGPFANIAHGCSSIAATKFALKLADYVITEAGFGADLGAEKFFDIKCRIAGLEPSAAVLVATIRALKYNGGLKSDELVQEDVSALQRGFSNLEKHVENLKKFGISVIVAINRFDTDTGKEIEYVKSRCKEIGVEAAFSEVFKKGGTGGIELAEKILGVVNGISSQFKPLYDTNASVKQKIDRIAKEIYGAGSVVYKDAAEKSLKKIEESGMDKLPVCIAKTQYSLSDNPKLLGRPEGFEFTIREIELSAGAGFIVAKAGEINTMPGLSKIPNAERITLSESGTIEGIF